MEITALPRYSAAPPAAERARAGEAGAFALATPAESRPQPEAARQRAGDDPAKAQTRQQARAPETTQISPEARILFEYEQQQRVMKVQDSKGVLIYQVPPKGALQLVLQEEQQAARVEDTA